MEPQKPAEGVMLDKEFKDSKFYKIACDCGSDQHDHHLVVEADPEVDSVSVEIYVKMITPYWRSNKLSIIWQLLTKGYIECESTIIMTKQQALNYSEVLKNAVLELEKNG